MRARRVLARVALSVALTGLISCGSDGAREGRGAAREAIENGTATLARPEVLRFFVGDGACTGTLLTPTHVLLAAHCVDYRPLLTGGARVMVQHPTLGTNWFDTRRTFSQGYAPGEADLAVAQLATAIPASLATPATLSATQPSSGAWLTAMGYGCVNDDGTGTGVKRYLEYVYTGGTTSYLCKGDSGGPVFLGRLGGGGAIVRVHSASYPDTDADLGADPVRYRGALAALMSATMVDGISYRAHLQGIGWQTATWNSGVAGTTGESRRLEGLQVWSNRPGTTVCATAHVQGVGWQAEVCDGALAGTYGQALRMEAVKIRLAAKPAGTLGVRYNAYLEGIGWQGWRQDNAIAGTTGQSRRIEALRVELY